MIREDDEQKQISSFFQQSGQRFWTREDLQATLDEMRDTWELPGSINTGAFIKSLLDTTQMTRLELNYAFMPVVRYCWGKPDLLEFLSAAYPRAYLSHASAIAVWQLSDNSTHPDTVYINVEQPPKPANPGQLSQSSIDGAFRKRPRTTNNRATCLGREVVLLSGKNTGDLGVELVGSGQFGMIRVTNLERTLIDIAVRPVYAGGAKAVLMAYRMARETVDVPKLAAILKQIAHMYPYHQSIAFYLERSGVRASDLKTLRDLGLHFDFYLENSMSNPAYDKQWRVHYPAELDIGPRD